MFCLIDRQVNLTGGKKKSLKSKSKNREESRLVRACLQYLQLKGFVAIRNNTGVFFFKNGDRTRAVRVATVGSPDIIACSPEGRFVAIECKSSKGTLTPAQKQFLEEIKKRGGITLVVRSIDDLLKEEALWDTGH